MSLLSISLGTYTPLEGSMSAKSLPEAKSLSSPSPSSISSLKLHVLAGDLSSVWGNPMDLSVFTESLQPDATVTVSVKLTSPEGFDPSVLRSIHTSFLLAGLVGTSEKKEGDGSRVLTARKIPKESIPGAAPLKNKKLIFNNVISLNLNDDSDLINEDNLLSDASNLLGVPPSMSAVATKDDCAGREPCENCSCGRADNQNGTANGGMKKENKAVDASACGKCGLGDAFRCASCPYLGKPAFKAGQEHLILDLQDDL